MSTLSDRELDDLRKECSMFDYTSSELRNIYEYRLNRLRSGKFSEVDNLDIYIIRKEDIPIDCGSLRPFWAEDGTVVSHVSTSLARKSRDKLFKFLFAIARALADDVDTETLQSRIADIWDSVQPDDEQQKENLLRGCDLVLNSSIVGSERLLRKVGNLWSLCQNKAETFEKVTTIAQKCYERFPVADSSTSTET